MLFRKEPDDLFHSDPKLGIRLNSDDFLVKNSTIDLKEPVSAKTVNRKVKTENTGNKVNTVNTGSVKKNLNKKKTTLESSLKELAEENKNKGEVTTSKVSIVTIFIIIYIVMMLLGKIF